jgi:hypothetical protein
MSTTMSRRIVRMFAGPVAVAGIIGGAMGMSAIAHANGAPMATPPGHPIVHRHAVQLPTQPTEHRPVSDVLGDR